MDVPGLLRACLLAIPIVLASGCGGGDRDEVVARASAIPAEEEASPATAPPSTGDAGLVVDVAGAVRRPGVYRLAIGSRVHEAIEAAGGARRGAVLDTLNRAAVLVDGQQVLVAAASDGQSTGAGTSGSAGAAGGLVNLNAADAAALDALPGIGEVTAGRIVDSREESGPFASLDDLDRVPGIGPATIESLRSVATT